MYTYIDVCLSYGLYWDSQKVFNYYYYRKKPHVFLHQIK